MGENLKGCCYVDVKEFESYKMRLIVEGVEDVSISRSKSGSNNSSTTYTEKDIIFSQNLSNYIENAKLSNSDYNKMEIPFEVIIPENILPSYDGKSARVRYKVKATIDKMKAIDSNKSITFNVFRKEDYTVHNNYTTTNTDKDNYTTLNLERTSFFPDEIIKGEILIHKSIPNLRRIELLLMGTEYARAAGYTDSHRSEIRTKLDKYYNNNINQFTFEITIPKDIKRSYRGKYSEFSWQFNIRFNRSFRSDISVSIPVIII